MTKTQGTLYSQESEMMVLGCMLTNINSFNTAADSLDKADFYHPQHQIIFQVLKKAHIQGKPADIHLVCEELKCIEKLDTVGGAAYIATLAQYAGTSAYLEYYIDLLIDTKSRRNLQEILTYSGLKPIEEIKQLLDQNLQTAIDRKTSIGLIYEHLLEPSSEKQVIEEVKNTSPGIRVGMKIGSVDLEFPGGAITIIAAPTSHGKTTMTINQALGILHNNPSKSVYFFSCEESMSAIISLFLNTYMGKEISQNNRRSIDSFFRTKDCQHIKEDQRELFLSDKKSFFKNLIDNGRLNVFYSEMAAEQLVQAIRYIRKSRDDIGAVFIDYMQLLNPLDIGRLSRQEQLKHVCLLLKDCAVETGLPIILGAQFNRQVTCEADLSPIYISEAGDIERIASLILGFWNRRFLGFSREGNKTKSGNVISTPRDEIYIEVLKGRKIGNGHSSVLSFHGNMGKIDNSLIDVLNSSQDSQYQERNIGKVKR